MPCSPWSLAGFALVASVATLVVSSGSAEACKCTPPSQKAVLKRSELVFTGRLAKVAQPAKPRPDVMDRYTFEVDTVFKGSTPRVVTVYSGTHSCGWRTRAINQKDFGEEFLVYARLQRGQLVVRQCDRSGPLSSKAARRDLRRLKGSGRAPDASALESASADARAFVGGDGHNLHALRSLHASRGRGEFLWAVDVLAACGPPAVGEPQIRALSASDGIFHLTVGKHSRVDVEATTGKVTCGDSD